MDPGARLVWRGLATRRPDGSCREQSGMIMSCRPETLFENVGRRLWPTKANTPCPDEKCLFDATQRCTQYVTSENAHGVAYMMPELADRNESWNIAIIGNGAGTKP